MRSSFRISFLDCPRVLCGDAFDNSCRKFTVENNQWRWWSLSKGSSTPDDPSRATDRCPQNCHFSPTSSGHCDNFHSSSCRLSRKQAVWNGCRATSVELMCNLWEEIASTREHNSLNVCNRQAQTILRLCPTKMQRMCNKCASSMWGCVHRASVVQQMWNSLKQTAALTEEKSTRGHLPINFLLCPVAQFYNKSFSRNFFSTFYPIAFSERLWIGE